MVATGLYNWSVVWHVIELLKCLKLYLNVYLWFQKQARRRIWRGNRQSHDQRHLEEVQNIPKYHGHYQDGNASYGNLICRRLTRYTHGLSVEGNVEMKDRWIFTELDQIVNFYTKLTFFIVLQTFRSWISRNLAPSLTTWGRWTSVSLALHLPTYTWATTDLSLYRIRKIETSTQSTTATKEHRKCGKYNVINSWLDSYTVIWIFDSEP